MKKFTIYTLVVITSLLLVPNQITATEKHSIRIEANTKEVPTDIKSLLSRLDEIKAMNKAEMNSSEKKILRKEVKSIKSALRSRGSGIYLSVGAIIIIVLLLIILL